MDVYVEQIVRRQPTVVHTLLKFSLYFFGGALCALLIIFSPLLDPFSMLAVAAAVGTGYGIWFLTGELDVEYEYIFTNGSLDVDKIIARKKRKRLLTVDLREITSMGKYDRSEHDRKQYDLKVPACRNTGADDDIWCLTFRDTKRGSILLIFNPNEKMMSSMKPYIRV